MTRRTDHVTAEKMSIALLTKAALGEDAAMHVARNAGVPFDVILEVFRRTVAGIRISKPGIKSTPERSRHPRKYDREKREWLLRLSEPLALLTRDCSVKRLL